MITQKVRKVGNSLIITIPREEVERLDLMEGDTVAVSVNKVRMEVIMSPVMQAAVDRVMTEYAATLGYLADK